MAGRVGRWWCCVLPLLAVGGGCAGGGGANGGGAALVPFPGSIGGVARSDFASQSSASDAVARPTESDADESSGAREAFLADDPVAAKIPGFSVRELRAGDGAAVVQPGSLVAMTFTGRIDGGREFQRQDEPAGPWPVSHLIPGLGQGLIGMRAGGRRSITIPPELAYSDDAVLDGSGEVLVPGGSTLVYIVEVVSIEEPADGDAGGEPDAGDGEPNKTGGAGGAGGAGGDAATPETERAAP